MARIQEVGGMKEVEDKEGGGDETGREEGEDRSEEEGGLFNGYEGIDEGETGTEGEEKKRREKTRRTAGTQTRQCGYEAILDEHTCPRQCWKTV